MPAPFSSRRILVCALFALFVMGEVVTGQLVLIPRSARPKPAAEAGADDNLSRLERQRLVEYVRERVEGAWAAADADGPAAGLAAADALFDRVVRYVPKSRKKVFMEVAGVRRIMRLLDAAAEEAQPTLLALLRDQRQLGMTVGFTVAEHDDMAKVAEVLANLHTELGDKVTRAPNLTAAICVVFDQDQTRRWSDGYIEPDTPERIFTYYAAMSSKLVFDLENTPPGLLVWMVSTPAKGEELVWAMGEYRARDEVGDRFFEIEYDYDHFSRGEPKKVAEYGYTLPNIKEHGGVCAEQAYFAANVGKAIGVPATYVRARGASMGHAWVGYLEKRGRRVAWNFNHGRYRDYQNIKGEIKDPTSGKTVADGVVGLTAELYGTSDAERFVAVAMTDAARRLASLGAPPTEPWVIPSRIEAAASPSPESEEDAGPENRRTTLADETSVTLKPREASVQAQLGLIIEGQKACPSYARGWFTVRDMATEGKLDLEQKKYWAGAVEKMCGSKYPDFTLALLKPMIQTVEDVAQQDALWDSVERLFRRRPDLRAEVLVARAAMWEKQGENDRAGRCYERVIQRHINDGPFVIDALENTARMLKSLGKADRIPSMMQQAWKRCNLPGTTAAAEFATQSNWYRIGMMYASALTEAGRDAEAREVRGACAERTTSTGG